MELMADSGYWPCRRRADWPNPELICEDGLDQMPHCWRVRMS
jgi:hypothetical protein